MKIILFLLLLMYFFKFKILKKTSGHARKTFLHKKKTKTLFKSNNANIVNTEKMKMPQKCRKIYIDMGANIGIHSRFIFQPELYPAKRNLKKMYALFDKYLGTRAYRKVPGNVCVFGFEANPNHKHRLNNLTKSYTDMGWKINYTAPLAVWINTDGIDMHVEKGLRVGSSMVNRTDRNGGKTVHVPSVDISDFVKYVKTKYEPDVIMGKLDIEGAEYQVLPALEKEGLLCAENGFGIITYEFHSRFVKGKRADWKIPYTIPCMEKTSMVNLDSEIYFRDGHPLPTPQHIIMPLQKRKLRNISALTGWYKEQPPVLFFMYDVPEYDKCVAKYVKKIEGYRYYKHGAEVWWLDQLRNSPWRTTQNDTADLYIIPLYPGWSIGRKMCNTEFQNALTRILKLNPFKKNVLLGTHYKSKLRTLCPTCINIGRYNISAPMMGKLNTKFNSHKKDQCRLTYNYTYHLRHQSRKSFESRPLTFYFAGQVDKRRAYRSRVQTRRIFKRMDLPFFNSQMKADIVPHTSNSQRKNFCSSMASARFGLHISGDTPQSSRMYEIINVGSVPVFMSDGIDKGYLPGLHIPWKDFVFFIKENQTDEQCEKSFIRIMNSGRDLVEYKRSILREYAPSLLWDAPNSVVAEMLLLDASISTKRIQPDTGG